MQEDRQPNETRLLRKGDHQVPKVRSSATLGHIPHRQPRTPHQTKKQRRKRQRQNSKKPTPGDRNAGFAGTSDNPFGEQGSSSKWAIPPPPPRDLSPARDRPATNPRPATYSILNPLHPISDSRPGPSRTTPLASIFTAPILATDTQGNPSAPPRPTRRLEGCDYQRLPGSPPLPGRTGHRPHHSGLRFKPGVALRAAQSLLQRANTQPPKESVKHETIEPQPAPVVLLQTVRRERSIKQEPDEITDLPLDSPDEEPFPMSVSDDPLNPLINLVPPAAPAERTSTGPSIRGFSIGSTILDPMLNLIKDPHDKPRSFIRYTLDFETGLANVSAHGFVDQIYMAPRWGRQMVRSPENPASEFVNGACVLNAYGSALLVLAHGRESKPITIHRLADRSPTRIIGSHDRPAVSGKPNGLTAICPMAQPLSFATGGADHAIHIWNIDHNLQTTCSGSPLAIRHTSKIYSLLPIQDSSHKLVSSGADCNVNVYDLSSERVVDTIKLSNPAFHVHHSGNPSILLVQTAHRERQFELRDLRGGSVDGTQVETFGFASNGLRLSRFSKGDVSHSTLFACGDLEGRVHIWDLRNVKQPATQVKCFQTEIKNVIWHESHILASSDSNHIAAIPYDYANSVIQTNIL